MPCLANQPVSRPDHVGSRTSQTPGVERASPDPLFPYVIELIPTCKFVIVVRDPRDIITSMIEVGKRKQELGEQHFFQKRDIKHLCEYIKFFYAPVFSSANQEFLAKVAVLKYENLINKPESIQQQLRQFTTMKLDFDARTEVPEDGYLEGPKPRYKPWRTKLSSGGLSDKSIGSYKTILSDEEVARIEVELGAFMERFDYA
ncbi:MAG TPA: hypothetical protein DCM64_08710 [Gammaproteobacteria bacterium]|nr:hypothetical protein [Gammaproteobacteria bacterium]